MKRIIICTLMLGVMFGGQLLPVWAESSHQITVSIPEICRYRIENVGLKPNDRNQVIQEVAVAVLSNSIRQWRLIARPESGTATVEWSEDGQNWQGFNNVSNTILSGNRSSWSSFRFYYRYQRQQYGAVEPLVVSYQILFD